MSLRFDPRLLIGGPFQTCPNCGAEEFGILGVGHEMCTRRCRACWFKAHMALPPLSRKVVYIDQFAISDMMKTLNAEHPHHAEAAANPFWRELFEALEAVVKRQLVICPDSDIHSHESAVSGWYEDLKLLYEHFSHGVSFDSTDEIAQRQLNIALVAWLDKKAPEYNFDAERVTHGAQGGINDWMDGFIISVSGEYPASLVEAFRKFRDEVHGKIRALFEEELRTTPHKDFEYWFKREREAGGRAILQARWLYEKRMHEIATGLVPFTYENVYRSNGLDQFNLIINVLKARGIPDNDLLPTLKAFIASDEFKDYPMNRITTLVWAAIGQAAANGQKEPPNAGTSNDIRVLSLAPYCDAMFVDNGCRALWMKIPTKYRKPYKAKMFSYNTRQQFLAYLRNIQEHADPAIVDCVHQVYGEPTPFFTIYEYDRNRRKRDKEARGQEG